MSGYPPIGFSLLQALIVSLVVLTPWLAMAFATRHRLSTGDALLLVPVYPVFALFTLLVFLPFEGHWADGAVFGPMEIGRALLIGATALLIGTLYTQRRGLANRSGGEIAHQLGASVLIGAGWGLVWVLAGWFLTSLGMANNG